MRKRISIFVFFLSVFAAVGPAYAVEGSFQYWAVSTHPCTIIDFDGESLSFDRYNGTSYGYYHIFNADFGVTDLIINETGVYDRIVAQETTSLRFKGWWTKKNGWTGGEAFVSEIDTCIETNRTITGAKIKTAGQWGQNGQRRPTIVAKYVPIYTITTSVEPGKDAGTATGDGIYEADETVTLKANPATGYSFLHWTKSNVVVSDKSTYAFTASANGAYVAVMTGNVYEVTFDRQEGTGGSSTAVVTYGEKAVTPIDCPKRFGWAFGGYYTEKNGEGIKVYNADGTPADVWKTAGNLTLYASWTSKPYDFTIEIPAFGVSTVSYRLNESDWTNVTEKTTLKVLSGTICHVFAKEQSGYVLGGNPGPSDWKSDGKPGYWHATMDGDGLIFAPQASWSGYRLTVNPNGGTYREQTQSYTWTERLRPGEKALNSIGTVTDGGASFLGFFDGLGEPVYDADGKNVEGTYWTAGYPDGVFRGTSDLTVYARWGQPPLTITVKVNDATMGSATGGGSFQPGMTVPLTAFAREGFVFLRWEKDGKEVSTENPYKVKVSSSSTYTAVFGKQTFTISFFGNGGTNEMASQVFAYNEAKELTSNTFERTGFDFAGWLTDPTNAAPTYGDGEIVSNLSARLFANWTPADVPPAPVDPGTNYLDNAYSVAADCATNRADGAVALELMTDKQDYCAEFQGDDAWKNQGKGNDKCVRLMPGAAQVRMWQEVAGPGTLEFYYKTSVEYKGYGYLSVKTNDSSAVLTVDESVNRWTKFSLPLKSPGTTKIVWLFQVEYDIGAYAKIDDIRWIPDDQPTPPAPPEPVEATTVGVTLRLNDGTPAPDDIYTNLTCEVGQEIGDLPEPNGVGDFRGWFTTNDVRVTETWIVPSEPVQLFAKWQYEVVEIPTAISGLVYDGTMKTGIAEGVGYMIVGNVATNAGDYFATVTLLDHYVWSDGESAAKEIAWSIGRATYDLNGVSMTNATYVYDGKPHSLAISGELPDGVTVAYSTNDCIEVGAYEVKASFTGDEVNHLKIETERFAMLTITATNAPPVDPDQPPVSAPITNEVPVAVTGLVYDGMPKTGVPAGEGYSLTGNVATAAGTYVATAAPDEGHVWSDGFARQTNITWSIAKGTPDVSGISFPDAVYAYDGNEHSFGIVGGLPSGVEVVYDGATNRTEVGTNTVTASISVTDTANWNVVSWTRTAMLIITPKVEPLDGAVANNYSALLADGSTLIVSTKKQSVKGGVTTIAVTAKRIVGKKTYSYSGGKIVDGEWVELPICKTAGMPRFDELVLTRDSLAGVFDNGLDISGNRLTQENFLSELIDWQSNSVVRVGVAFAAQVGVSELCRPVKFSAKKLPSGLKINKTTGEITGVPTKAKDFTPRITATSTVSSKLKAYTDFEITVAPIDPWAVGTFNGGGEACQVKVTVSKTGKISGQLLTNGLKWKLSAKSFSDYSNGVYSATLTCKNGKTTYTNCVITVSEKDGLVGACDEIGGRFIALRNEWKDADWKLIAKGFPKATPLVLSPIGNGFDTNDTITLKFSSSGAVTAKGKFVKSYSSKTGKPSFYSVSRSTVLCPVTEPDNASGAFGGIVHVYFPRKAKTPLEDGDYIVCVPVLWDGSKFDIWKSDDE